MSTPTPDNDAMFEILVNALQEIWVLQDRQMVLERVLDEAGVEVSEAVERFQPDEAFESRLAAARQRFLDSVLSPVLPDD